MDWSAEIEITILTSAGVIIAAIHYLLVVFELGVVRDDIRAHDGVTPLHVAALKDAGRVARVLPSHGVNVGARADDGVTALHVAAMKDASGIVAALVSHGADLNATDAAGQAGAALGGVGGTPWPRSKPSWTAGRACTRVRTTAASPWTQRCAQKP